MWPRRQLKAQRRRAQRAASTTRSRLPVSALASSCLLIALAVLMYDSAHNALSSDDHNLHLLRPYSHVPELRTTRILRFLCAYPQRFYAFYAPKIELLARGASAAVNALELSDDVSASFDFAVAFVAVASVYHAIEVARHVLLRRLQPSLHSDNDDDANEQDKRAENARVRDTL